MSSTFDDTGGEQSAAASTADEPTGTEEPASEPVTLPLEQVFDVLRNERRRLVLVHMAENDDGTYTIGDLAEHVASHENDKPIVQLSSDERKRAYVGLYQAHLPKMDAMDIVSFNKARGKVEIGPNHDRVEPYLQERTMASTADRWPRRYLGLSAVALLAVALAGLGGAAAAWAAAAAVVVGFVVTSVCHWWLTATDAADA
jgi:hypothetical protein